MNKEQFLSELKQGLSAFAEADIRNSLDYYAEMIDDRIEDGKTEEEAVADLGNVQEIISQILLEMPLKKLVRAKTKPKKTLSAWEIVLLVLGFPLWFSLLISAVAVVFSIFISFWAVLVLLYAVPISLAASALGCIGGAVIFAVLGYAPQALCTFGAVFVLIALAILTFWLCHFAALGLIWCSKMLFRGIKRMFIGKRGEKNA